MFVGLHVAVTRALEPSCAVHNAQYVMYNMRLIATLLISGELIVSKYVAESIAIDAGRFGHEGLCQLRTKLKIQQCETAI